MRATRLLGALIVLACAGATPVRAVVTGSIFGPGSQTLAVAVVPLESKGEGSGGLGGDFARVLSRDLELSGYFRLIDPKTFVEGAGVAPEAIDYVGWSAIGTQELVKGTIETSGDTVTVEVRLFDVAERRDVAEAGRRFQASRSELPRLAHRYADQLLEVLTGERGPFESKIALISTREGPLKDVYVYTFDMPAPARLTNERSITLSPNWQPDHRGVLFTSYRDHQPRLFEIDLARRAVVQFSSGDRVYLGGAWSPDGTQVLASREDAGNSDIELLDRYGAVVRRLTDHWGIDVSPSWSPDGRRFAFCSSRSGAPQIYTMGVSDVRAAPGLEHRQLQHVAGVVAEGRSHRVGDAERKHLPDRGRERRRRGRAHASPARAATRIRRGRRTAATSCSRRRAADGARCGSPIATGVLRNN